MVQDQVAECKKQVYTIKFSMYGRHCRVSGQAAGFLIDSENKLLVTCAHVVAPSDTIWAVQGKKVYATRLERLDMVNDLAILRLTTEKRLPVATLGKDDPPRVGTSVFVIGSPSGLRATVTFGRVSAVKRNFSKYARGVYPDLIQTDAPINPGNSGGPMYNMRGEVLGVACLHRRGADGLSFCIPVKYVRRLLESWLSAQIVEQKDMAPGLEE